MPTRAERMRATRDAKIAQIRDELAQGRIASALGRARGLVSTFPFSVAVRDVAGEACHQAGEQMSAGLHWSLSGRDDAVAAECIRRFERVHETACAAFDAYRFRELPFGRFDEPRVNAALDALKVRLDAEGYRYDHLLPRNGRDPGSGWTPGDIAWVWGTLATMLLALGIFGVGVVQVWRWLFG